MSSPDLELAWPVISALLDGPEAVPMEMLLEEGLGVPWTDPEAAALRQALGKRLREGGNWLEVSPGLWLAKGRVPAPPRQVRMPTVRMDRGMPILVEAHQAWHELLEEEGHWGFSVRLSFREIQQGMIRLSKYAASLFPDRSPVQVRLSLEDRNLTAWVALKPYPMLYGIEGWIWEYNPGQYLSFERIGEAHFGVKVLDRFDETYYRSESRLFDLNTLRRLRRFGRPYREHVRQQLSRHPQGLTIPELLDSLELELGFRPHPPTIRGLLSAGSEFEVMAHRWRLTTLYDDGWNADYEELERWFEVDGAAIQDRANYRGLMMTVGGSLEPLTYSLRHSRPEGVCFIVSEDTAQYLAELRLALVVSPDQVWVEVVSDHQDLNACLQASQRAFQRMLEGGLSPQEILVDITGGTKVMSAAAAIATHMAGCAYSYIGGRARNKNNVGIVLSGTEIRLITTLGRADSMQSEDPTR